MKSQTANKLANSGANVLSIRSWQTPIKGFKAALQALSIVSMISWPNALTKRSACDTECHMGIVIQHSPSLKFLARGAWHRSLKGNVSSRSHLAPVKIFAKVDDLGTMKSANEDCRGVGIIAEYSAFSCK